MTVAALGLLAVVAVRMPAQQPLETLQGHVRVIDGDSLMLGGTNVRLQGIDAPELAQSCTRNDMTFPCGQQALAELSKLINGHVVSCESLGQDRYGRTLARCKAGAKELNSAMVETGWAVAYGSYDAQEREARKASRGIWQGEFTTPQEWRRAHDGFADAPDNLPSEPVDNLLASLWDWMRGWIGF